MSSWEEFESLSETLEDDSPLSNTSSDYLAQILSEYHLLDRDHADPPPFESSELDNFGDAPNQAFDQSQSYDFDRETPNTHEQAVPLVEEHTSCHKYETTALMGNKSNEIETSDTAACAKPIPDTQLIETQQCLRLRTPPHPYQRARYEKELEEDLRYISTPNDSGIELEIPDLRSALAENVSVMMRVSRTTTAYGPEGIICCHPYPLYTTNAHAVAHQGSMLFPVTSKQMEDQLIKIEDLINCRSLQSTLRRTTEWPIYTPNQLDCNGYHSVDTSKPKDVIRNYNLRYFILRFQVFLVDENQMAYASDLLCETEPIYEYEYKELRNFPAPFGSQTKRLQRQSIEVKRKRVTKTNRLKGLIRTTNAEQQQ